MIEQGKKALAELLVKSTFEGINYFNSIKVGCYQVDDTVFYDIKQHPSLVRDYRRRLEMQDGAGPSELWSEANKWTCFKSVSQYHLEFDSGVVIVRGVQ